jgi:hypothetical protein
MKFFITLFVLVCSLLITTTPIHAQTAVQDNFSTSVATTYTVKPDGATIVTHNFTITNKTPTTYLKQYALQTTSKDLKNISAKSENIVLQPAVSEASGLTTIALDFPTEVVGEGKRRQFGLSYEVGGLASYQNFQLQKTLRSALSPSSPH